eukprot:COSAG03_NODE_9259_length_734_cov_1.072441_1_plen_42_part_10
MYGQMSGEGGSVSESRLVQRRGRGHRAVRGVRQRQPADPVAR